MVDASHVVLVVERLEEAYTALDAVGMLPSIAKAVSASDYSEITLLMLDVAGLKPCVEGLAAAVE